MRKIGRNCCGFLVRHKHNHEAIHHCDDSYKQFPGDACEECDVDYEVNLKM